MILSTKPYFLLIILFLIPFVFLFPVQKSFTPDYSFIKSKVQVDSLSFQGALIRFKGGNYLVQSQTFPFEMNDYLYIEGKIIFPIEDSNGFHQFLRGKGITGVIYPQSMSLISHSSNWKAVVYHHFAKNDYEKGSWINMLLFNLRAPIAKSFYQTSISLGVAHVLVVSGMHIGLIYYLIRFLLRKTKYQNQISLLLFLLIMIPYLQLLNFSVASVRATLFVLIIIIRRILNFKPKGYELSLALTLFVCFILYPSNLDSLDFILTFWISFIIFKLDTLIKNPKYKKIKISLIIYCITQPLFISLNKFWGPLNLGWSLLLTPIIMIVYILMIVLSPFPQAAIFLLDSLHYIMTTISETNWEVPINGFPTTWTRWIYYFITTTFFIIEVCDFSMVKKLIWLKKN